MRQVSNSSLSLRFLGGAAVLAVAMFAAQTSAQAADWKPTRNVEIAVGTAPASGIEIDARAIQKIIEDNKLVDQPITVSNREGGAMSISWSYINQHPGDGHYMAMLGLQIVTNALTGVNPISIADVTPLAVIGEQPVGVAVRTDSTVTTAADLADKLKADTQSLSIGLASSRGNGVHISLSLALQQAGVDPAKLKIVVFPSSGEAMVALLGGHIDVLAAPTSAIAPQLEAAAVRGLAVSTKDRLPAPFQDTPTWVEQGIDVAFGIPYGIAGPKDMPAEQVAFWDSVFAKVFVTDEWKTTAINTNLNPLYLNSSESTAYWADFSKNVEAIIADLGMN